MPDKTTQAFRFITDKGNVWPKARRRQLFYQKNDLGQKQNVIDSFFRIDIKGGGQKMRSDERHSLASTKLLATFAFLSLILGTFSSNALAFQSANAASYSRNSFDGLIINENAILGVCGEMKFVRQNRNCLDESVYDLKQCLKLNNIDPLFKEGTTATYNCVNSSSSGGAEVIRTLLEESEIKNSCLAQNVRFFYEELIESDDFRAISRDFEETLGFPLVLSLAIDTRDSISSLQLDLSDIEMPGIGSESINLNIAAFKEQAPCQTISRSAVIERVSEELSRLTMIASQRRYDPYEQQSDIAGGDNRVFDSGRFSNAGADSGFDSEGADNLSASDSKVDYR
jgi:hypothetical protein